MKSLFKIGAEQRFDHMIQDNQLLIYMCVFIVWYPLFSADHNLHPWYWNSLLYSLISSGENSAFVHFATDIAGYQVPTTAGWTEAAWYERLVRHLYTWPAVRLQHQSPIRVLTSTNHCSTSVIWRELLPLNHVLPYLPCESLHAHIKLLHAGRIISQSHHKAVTVTQTLVDARRQGHT